MIPTYMSFFKIRLEVEPKHSFEEYSKHVPKSTAAVRMLCDELLHPGDVFDKYPDVIKIYEKEEYLKKTISGPKRFQI